MQDISLNSRHSILFVELRRLEFLSFATESLLLVSDNQNSQETRHSLLKLAHFEINPGNIIFSPELLQTIMLTLGLSDVQLVYLAEGAANTVYRIQAAKPEIGADSDFESTTYGSLTPPPTEMEPLYLDPSLEGKLVRLRKNLSTTVPVAESYSHYKNIICPLFLEETLVQADIFQPTRDLLRECNADLREMEKADTRPPKRHGLYLAEDEKHGCLITDMSWIFDDSYNCFEFKPKWLIQSPSAPSGSRRCRTCALQAMKSTGEDVAKKASFCPLDLVSDDRDKVANVVPHVLGPRSEEDSNDGKEQAENLRTRVVEFLYNNPLLHRLKQVQLDLDPVGVLKADLKSQNFLAAMTLRDCSLFLKVSMPLIKCREVGH